jgi:hypothetical protein
MKASSASSVSVLLIAALLHTQQSVSAFSIPTPIIEFSLSAVAGGAGAFAAYPFDYIKSQMQTESGKAKYKNSWDCVRDTLEQGGPLLLYRGVVVTSLGNAPEKALKLYSHDFAKSMLTTAGGTITVGNEILAGAISGVLQVVLTSPLETVKVALQTSDMTMQEVMAEIGGIKGLFKGYETCITRDVIFNSILFPVYSHLRAVLPDEFAGAIAGVLATFAGTPTDVVKTRILSKDSLRRKSSDSEHIDVPQRFALSSQPRLTTATAMAAMSTDYAEGDASSCNNNKDDDYLSDTNPFVVGYKIATREGAIVLLSGAMMRCVGSVPRFGVTLALHDLLKTAAVQHNWL